jgi:hypothetical protein
MRFLFARNFFHRLLVRGFDRNIWHQWDFVWSTFLLRIRSRISQKYLALVRSCLLTFLLRISSRDSQKYMASSMMFLFAWNFFRGFDRGFHRNIWHHSDFVCSTFLCGVLRGSDRNIWDQWDFFCSKFFLRIRSDRAFDRNIIWRQWDFVSSTFLLWMSSRLWQKIYMHAR